jgi:hypothetical protein
MQLHKIIAMLIVIICLSPFIYSQNEITPVGVINFPEKAIFKITEKVNSFDGKLIDYTEGILRKMQRREKRLMQKLQKKDSTAAKNIFNNSEEEYTALINGFRKNQMARNNKVGEFLPNLDSLNTGLKFLSENKSKLGIDQRTSTEVSSALTSVKSLQERMKNISTVQSYLKQRKQLLKEQLSKYGFTKELKKINRDVYYFKERVTELKSTIDDPRKLELAAFRFLNKIPSFKDFFEKHSFIASVFGSSNFTSFNNSASAIPDIPGLQSRTQVDKIISAGFLNSSAASGNPSDILREKLSVAKDELNQIKSKSSSWDENAEMPDFRPNEMKAKSFLKRIEAGTNLQFSKPTSLLPSTADIAGQLAYKFHQNGSFGIGASYKLGYGNIRRLSITHQGVGLRSFADYRVKGKFFVNGGFEYNYNAAFQNIPELTQSDSWQKSALIGLSRKYKISKKLRGNFMVLYDFLHNQHTPISQPILIRFGYNF